MKLLHNILGGFRCSETRKDSVWKHRADRKHFLPFIATMGDILSCKVLNFLVVVHKGTKLLPIDQTH